MYKTAIQNPARNLSAPSRSSCTHFGSRRRGIILPPSRNCARMQVDVVNESILRRITVFPILAGSSNAHPLDVKWFRVRHGFKVEVLKIQFHVFPPIEWLVSYQMLVNVTILHC